MRERRDKRQAATESIGKAAGILHRDGRSHLLLCEVPAQRQGDERRSKRQLHTPLRRYRNRNTAMEADRNTGKLPVSEHGRRLHRGEFAVDKHHRRRQQPHPAAHKHIETAGRIQVADSTQHLERSRMGNRSQQQERQQRGEPMGGRPAQATP